MMHKVVSHAEWEKIQAEFLKKEKEFTRMREQLANNVRNCRGLWVKRHDQYSGDTTKQENCSH